MAYLMFVEWKVEVISGNGIGAVTLSLTHYLN